MWRSDEWWKPHEICRSFLWWWHVIALHFFVILRIFSNFVSHLNLCQRLASVFFKFLEPGRDKLAQWPGVQDAHRAGFYSVLKPPDEGEEATRVIRGGEIPSDDMQSKVRVSMNSFLGNVLFRRWNTCVKKLIDEMSTLMALPPGWWMWMTMSWKWWTNGQVCTVMEIRPLHPLTA